MEENLKKIGKEALLIGEFMNWTIKPEGYNGVVPIRKSHIKIQPDWYKFNTSWKWLMPVVERIATLKDGVSISMHYGTGATDSFSNIIITYWRSGEKHQVFTPMNEDEDGSEGFLYNTYKTVVKFIEIWNQKPIQNGY